MSKESGERDITVNRRAFHDYTIGERFEAGLVLIGSEVKSLRDNRAHLRDAYAGFVGDELWLIGAHISPYGPASQFGHDPTRNRKLLMHRRELERLHGKVQEKGLTLVPLRLYWSKGRAKAELGLGKGKKFHDKRESERSREMKAEAKAALGRRGRD